MFYLIHIFKYLIRRSEVKEPARFLPFLSYFYSFPDFPRFLFFFLLRRTLFPPCPWLHWIDQPLRQTRESIEGILHCPNILVYALNSNHRPDDHCPAFMPFKPSIARNTCGRILQLYVRNIVCYGALMVL